MMAGYSELAQSSDNEFRFDREKIHGFFEGNGQNRLQGWHSRKLFVGGLSWNSTIESFTRYFKKYGEVIDSVILHDKQTGTARGFGFVTFADTAAVDIVLGQRHFIDSKLVDVKRSIPKVESVYERRIFVGRLPPSITSYHLLEYFSSYGRITNHRVVRDQATRKSKGFGFVTFENKQYVTSLLSLRRRHVLEGKEVVVRRAKPRKRSHGGTRVVHGGYDNGGQYSGSYRAYGNNNGSGSYDRFYRSHGGFRGGFGAYPCGFGYRGPLMMLPDVMSVYYPGNANF